MAATGGMKPLNLNRAQNPDATLDDVREAYQKFRREKQPFVPESPMSDTLFPMSPAAAVAPAPATVAAPSSFVN